MRGRALAIAVLGASCIAGAALVLRLLGARGELAAGQNQSMSDWLPLLFVAAGLCTAALLRDRSAAVAWLAATGVAALAALETFGMVRAWQPTVEVATWRWLVLVAEGALLGAAAITGAYATRKSVGTPARWAAAWRLLVLAGLAGVAVAAGWAMVEALGAPAPGVGTEPPVGDLPPLRISARIAAGFVAITLIAGALRDLAGPVRRAMSRSSGIRELPRAITEELLPYTTTARRRGRDDERARLAADLHALVLPDLRRAAEAAEAAEVAGAPATPAAADLRQAVEGVERLMHERQSVVLEQFGLVAALEWLAERTQEHSRIEVAIELDGSDVHDPGAVPLAVGRAAFRFALLALDNVVRHADARRAVVRMTVTGSRGRLAVIDDGRGLDQESSGRGGRGLIDMRTAAAEIGGAIRVERRDGATAVELTWGDATAIPEDHASPAADHATRPAAPGAPW